MIQIKSLENTNFKVIHACFLAAFSDYTIPFQLTEAELRYMLDRRDCNYALSFGAFEGDELVGLILNAIGDWQGKRTAYDTGTGIIKAFRGKGISKQLFQDSLPILRAAGVTQYLLEVIQTNTKAVNLYQKTGFQTSREFDFYGGEKTSLHFERNSNLTVDIKPIATLDAVTVQTFWNFRPSWQNSLESVARKQAEFTTLGVFLDERLLGYGIIERHTGDIPQLAIHPDFRRKGLATKLLEALVKVADTERIKFINAASDDISFRAFMASLGWERANQQYEMVFDV